MIRNEAIQKTALTNAVWDVVRTHLSGVLPFPDGEDSFIFKATYFKFKPEEMDIALGADVKVTVDDSSITLYINRNCDPNGGFSQVMVEPVSPENPFAKAIINVLNVIVEEIQKHGKDWCRIGNYKALVIQSPYIDRLKAFCMQNPDVKIPMVANDQLAAVKDDSPEVLRTLNAMNGESLPEAKVDKINAEIPDGVKPRVRKVAPDKPMSDRQKKRQLNKLLAVGIGGGKDKPKPSNPRVRRG